MYMHYVDQANARTYGFELSGDQWMIEGYILRWKPFLRFLGAKPYYKVTRFSGRWESPDSTHITNHQLWTEPGHWKWLLQHGQQFPLIDAVQGIAAFQYPDSGTYYVYITDPGFVLKK
jgi:outer membrane receptor protein involved in Fe transport